MEKIISFIISPKIEGVFIYLKFTFIILGLFFFLGIIVLILKSSWLKRRFLEYIVEILVYRPFGVKKTFKQWTKIIKRLEIEKDSEYKLAIIEADNLLNDTFEKMGYKGETTGEKLNQLDPAALPNIDQVWQAHKIRNNIIHDPDYKLNLDQAKKTIAIYEKTFRDLEVF